MNDEELQRLPRSALQRFVLCFVPARPSPERREARGRSFLFDAEGMAGGYARSHAAY
ncbi:MAG TPA: hypothetical protein VFU68_04270 [Terracidiphilus sp.]|nr:hypothetical protein [Terracidiphilus sp.]